MESIPKVRCLPPDVNLIEIFDEYNLHQVAIAALELVETRIEIVHEKAKIIEAKRCESHITNKCKVHFSNMTLLFLIHM